MSKQIKVADEVYDRLKADADANYRSMSGQVEYLMDKAAGVSVILGNKVATTEPPDLSGVFKETPKKIVGATPRGKGEVLADIRELEAKRDEELRYCQDDEIGRQITEQYADKVNPLWEEYNGL